MRCQVLDERDGSPGTEDAVQHNMATVTMELNETWHICPYISLDPFGLILRLAPQPPLRMKLLYNFVLWEKATD